MTIALPLLDDNVATHFGHCATFALITCDDTTRTRGVRKDIAAPAHEPGRLPLWLAAHGVNTIITGGMGQRAQQLCEQNGIKVLVGATSGTPESIVDAYLAGTLVTQENPCDH